MKATLNSERDFRADEAGRARGPAPFTGPIRVILYVVAFGLGAPTVHAEDKPVPVRKTRLIIDCTRYLAAALVRNFSPRALGKTAVVPVVEVDPKTIRSEAEEIAEAVKRAITFAEDPEKFLATRPLGDPFASLDLLNFFGLDRNQRARLRKYGRALKSNLTEKLRVARLALKTKPEASTDVLRYEKMLLGADSFFHHLDHPPRKTASRLPEPEFPSSSGKGEQNVIVAEVEKWVDWLFGKRSPPARLVRDVKGLVVAESDGINARNEKIIEHWTRELMTDSVLYADTLAFYSRLHEIDRLAAVPHPGKYEAMFFDPPGALNVWNMALDVTHGDVTRALRTIAVFGHDDLSQSLFQSNVYLRLTDFFVPRQNSFLYTNGAIDGLGLSRRLRDRFAGLKEDFESLRKLYPNSAEVVDDGFFRSGNYHFIGGAMMVVELLAKGDDHYLGVNLPVLAAEAAGKAYKRITMETTYMNGEERYLFDRGYPTIPVARPADWTEEQYAFRKFKVRLQLAHLDLTHEQHLRGAEWAYDLLKKNGITRYTPKDYVP